MYILRLALPIAAMGVGWAWLGAGSASEQMRFEMPAKQLASKLRASTRTVEGTGMGSLTMSGFALEPRVVQISIHRAGGAKSPKCMVTIGEESPEVSTATLNCAQPGENEDEAKRLGGEALAIVVGEHVKATGEGRPYDVDSVADRMIAFAATNGPAMAAVTMGRKEK